jgi:hypothetical protein
LRVSYRVLVSHRSSLTAACSQSSRPSAPPHNRDEF